MGAPLTGSGADYFGRAARPSQEVPRVGVDRAHRARGVRIDLYRRADSPGRELSYLDDIAAEIERRVDPRVLPGGETRELFRLYAVLALAKGPAVQAADIHDAWVAWQLGRDADHPSIKPFDRLDPETRPADEPFVKAVREAADGLEGHGRWESSC